MAAEIHVDDVGTVFEATLRDETDNIVNISAASERIFVFRKPGGQILEVPAVLTTDGQDGAMQYATESGDLDQPGYWKVQGHVTIGSWQGNTDIYEFRVYPNLR